MDDLITRLEAARIGNVELSAEIARDVVGMTPHEPGGWPFWFRDRNGTSVTPCPAYTTSVDAALELVPRGGEIFLYSMYNGVRRPTARVFGSSSSSITTWGEGEGRSLALALCIAALRARKDRP